MRLISENTLKNIEESLGLGFLEDKEKKSETMREIIGLISSRAGMRIMKQFNDEETREFNKIPEDNLEEMEDYILSKNPDAREIFEEEAQKVKEELLKTKI